MGSNEQFILAVDALSATPFANIRRNLTISGLITDDITADDLSKNLKIIYAKFQTK